MGTFPHRDGRPTCVNRQSRQFEPETDQVVAARRFVTGTLADWGLASPDAALLVSELATNAVLHARSDFAVAVAVQGATVRVEVFDRNPRLPSVAAVPADAYSGRGLAIVADLSSAWGVESHPGAGKTIWFELPGAPTA